MFTNVSAMLLPVMMMTPPGDSASAAVRIQSLWDFVVKGGPVMIPIGLCSLVAFAVLMERLLSLRRRAVLPPQFVPNLSKVLRESAGDVHRALEYCRAHPSPLARVIGAGVKRLGEPVETLERHVQEAGEREALRLRRNLRVLSVIAAVSPLLGLLGTIFGMITAFQTVAASGEALGKTELLAEGIYEAMITTAAGLIVAIPALVCYHWLAAKIDGLIMRLDQQAVEFLEDDLLSHRPASAMALPTGSAVPSHHNGTSTTEAPRGVHSSVPQG